eukprot:4075604-Pyramimonas_sp.AAC.1
MPSYPSLHRSAGLRRASRRLQRPRRRRPVYRRRSDGENKFNRTWQIRGKRGQGSQGPRAG